MVEKSDKYGYCITKPTQELIDLVRAKTRAGCFKLERMKTYIANELQKRELTHAKNCQIYANVNEASS